MFAGVGKSDKEINYALDHDILCFNVESVPELVVIDELANLMMEAASDIETSITRLAQTASRRVSTAGTGP